MIESVELIDEEKLTASLRRRIAAIFPPKWRQSERGVSARAWTQAQPVVRLLAWDGPTLVGHQSIVNIRVDSPLVLGLGDLVVRERYRNKGIARTLINRAIETCAQRGADVILTATDKAGLRGIFFAQGFEPSYPFEFYFKRGDRWIWNETWIRRVHAPKPRSGDPIELMSDC